MFVINPFATVSSVSNLLTGNQLRESLRRWVTPPDPSANHNIARDIHHRGTAEWFFRCSIFEEGKSTGSLLWIYGKRMLFPLFPNRLLITVCVLSWLWQEHPLVRHSSAFTRLKEFTLPSSSTIIQDVVTLREAKSALMAYFYFDFRDLDKQHRRNLLPSLLIQLSGQSRPCCDIISHLYSAYDDGAQKPNDSVMIRCLKDMLTIPHPRPVYIILDALDECPNSSGISSPRGQVLALVKELVDLRLPHLYICITSRPEFDIRATLTPLTRRCVSLHDESGQKKDIINYVNSVVFSNCSLALRQ